SGFSIALARRAGVVSASASWALARKLAIALWRYVEHGEIPEGAALKAEESSPRRRRACSHWCEPLVIGPGPPDGDRPIDGAARPNGPAHGRSWSSPDLGDHG